METTILKIVGKHLGRKTVRVNDNFITDLGADSLDIIEIVMTVEERFEIEIHDELLPQLITVDNLVHAVKTIVVDASKPSCFTRRLGVEACHTTCPVSDECYK